MIGAEAAAQDQPQWPNGKNVCGGVWTYQESQECEHASHGPDAARPIIETNGTICGYEQKTATCWHGFTALRSIVTDVHNLSRDHDYYSGEELREFCREQATHQQLNERETISTWDYESVGGGDRCLRRDKFRKCQERTHFADIKCHYTVSGPTFGQDQSCGTIDDVSRPRACQVGLHNKLARSANCPKVRRETTRGFDFSGLMSDPSLSDVVCSTGDHLPADRPEQAKAKFAFLSQKLWSLPSSSHPDWPVLLQGLKTLLDSRAEMLSDVEKSLASQMVYSSFRSVHTVKNGPIFSTADDCVEVYSDEAYRGCRSKQIKIQMDNVESLKRLSSYVSLGLKISYDHGCKLHTDDLKVRLNSDAANQLLSPTDPGNTQWVKLVFAPSGDSPTISIDINPAAKISKACQISIENVEVSLDVKILEQFSELLISKLTMLNTVKLQLLYPEASPDISALISKLDSEFNTVVTRHQFDCQEEAKSLGIATPALCQVSEDYRSLCHLDPTPTNGIAPSLFERIHEDACLLADLQTFGSEERCDYYPDRRQGTFCGEHTRSIRAFLDQEYVITKNQAKELAETLSIEGERMSNLSSELSSRIKLVIERLGTKMSELEQSR
jgi:hypothetical protein